jgi:hypothetical protein
LGETTPMIVTAKLDNTDHPKTVRLPAGVEVTGDG